jgi:hypothetical protein
MIAGMYRDITKKPDFVLSCATLSEQGEIKQVQIKPTTTSGVYECPSCVEHARIVLELLARVKKQDERLNFFESRSDSVMAILGGKLEVLVPATLEHEENTK